MRRLVLAVLCWGLGEVDARMLLSELDELYRHKVGVESRAAAERWRRREMLRAVFHSVLTRIRAVTERPIPHDRPENWAMHGTAFPGFRRRLVAGASVLVQDVRLALRQLRSSPGYAAAVVLTFALAVGPTTAVFSVVDHVLLQPLPIPDADRVVQIWDEYPSLGTGSAAGVSFANYLDYGQEDRGFDAIGGAVPTTVFLTGGDGTEEVAGLYASSSLLSVLGTEPILGRGFLPADEAAPSQPVALLSSGLWRSRFGGDPDVIGRTVQVRTWGSSFGAVVVGVLPETFTLPPLRERRELARPLVPEIVFPLGLYTQGREDPRAWTVSVLGRLRDGIAVDEAQRRMDAVAGGIAAAYPEASAGYRVAVVPLGDLIEIEYGKELFFLWAAAGFVLLVACGNLAGLILGRGIVRRTEMAVRVALGGWRTRLVSQLFTESSVAGLLGGGLGLFVSFWGTRALAGTIPGEVYRIGELAVDLRLLAFGGLGTMAVVLLASAVPALSSLRVSPVEVMKGASRGVTGTMLRPLRGLIVAQVALTLILLAGAGLMLRTFLALSSVDPGVSRRNVLTLDVRLLPPFLSRYPSLAERWVVWHRIEDRVGELPGVLSVARIGDPPMNGAEWEWNVTLADRPAPAVADQIRVDFRDVSARYFETMQIPLLEGRTFTAADVAISESVLGLGPEQFASRREELSLPVVVNQTMARRFWPGGTALGKGLYWGVQDPARLDDPTSWDPQHNPPILLTVIGVVREVTTLSLDQDPRLQVYIPRTSVGSMVVRTSSEPMALAGIIRTEIESIDPAEIRVARVSTLDESFSGMVAPERFRLLLVGLFAALALSLTAVGLFGLVSHAVNERATELGIRMALGALPGDIHGLIGKEWLRVVAIGTMLGLPSALVLSRSIAGLLYGVTPADPLCFVVSGAFVLVVTAVAAYLPVKRSIRSDPGKRIFHGS